VLRAIICADWSRNSARRAAYVADIPTRLVKRLGSGPFTLRSLVDTASAYPGEGSVLVGIDAPLGAPRSLLAATHQELGLPATANFVDWVTKATAFPAFFSRAVEGAQWSPLRPFFMVAPGADGRNRLFRAIRERGRGADGDARARARHSPLHGRRARSDRRYSQRHPEN